MHGLTPLPLDLQDQVDGVKLLSRRPYIDGNRVGVYGTSHGGYMAAQALFKYPEVFTCGVANAGTMDNRYYTAIYIYPKNGHWIGSAGYDYQWQFLKKQLKRKEMGSIGSGTDHGSTWKIALRAPSGSIGSVAPVRDHPCPAHCPAWCGKASGRERPPGGRLEWG